MTIKEGVTMCNVKNVNAKSVNVRDDKYDSRGT